MLFRPAYNGNKGIMGIPGNARPIGRTVRFGYAGAVFVFALLVAAASHAPTAAAAGLLGKTLDGVANKTVPALTDTLTDTTAPVTNIVSPSLTSTVDSVADTASSTLVPAATTTVKGVTAPVVDTVGNVTGPAVPTVLDTVDNVAAPVTNDVLPAAADTVDTVATPVANTAADVVAPVVTPITKPVSNAVEPVVSTITRPVTSVVPPLPSLPHFPNLPNLPVLSRLAAATKRPLALTASATGIPTVPIARTTGLQAATGTSLTDLLGDVAKFFVGVLPPFTWLPGGGDTNHAITIWKILSVALLGVLAAIVFGGIYRRLRRVQRDMYLINEDLALVTALNPGTARIAAVSTAFILVGIFVLYAVLAGA